jgi:hypothetical protein
MRGRLARVLDKPASFRGRTLFFEPHAFDLRCTRMTTRNEPFPRDIRRSSNSSASLHASMAK